MPFAEIRGFRLFFTEDGAGPPMVFVHGFSCDSHDWSWQLPHFAATHRVIAPDLRGHGRSGAPASGYDVASLAADVLALIEHLGCEPVVAVGHSLGGAIAAVMAAERKDLVRAVVAIDPGHLLPDETGPYLASALAAYGQEDPGEVAARFFQAGSHTAATPRGLASWHNRRAVGTPPHVLRQTIAGLIGGVKPFALVSNSLAHLGTCDSPTLAFYIDPVRQALAETILVHPHSRTVCFEGSGHWLHQECPEAVNSIVDQWVGELPPPDMTRTRGDARCASS